MWKEMRVSSVSDTLNLGTLPVDIRNRVAVRECENFRVPTTDCTAPPIEVAARGATNPVASRTVAKVHKTVPSPRMILQL